MGPSGPVVAIAAPEVPNQKSSGKTVKWIVNPPCFPMPAPAAICEYGKHRKALAASRKSPNPQRGDTARVRVSPLGGYCFTWKSLHIGRVLLQSFLGSQTLILRDKILGKKIRNQNFK